MKIGAAIVSLSADIIDFYLTKAPHAHSDKPDSAQSLDLASRGWEKTKLDRLMKWVATEHSEGPGVTFSLSNDVSKKAKIIEEKFNSSKAVGGAFCIKRNLACGEDNTISCRLTETYATCFFRHLRNSIAHGNYRIDGSDIVTFKDQACSMGTANPAPTAIFITRIAFLKRLNEVVEQGPSAITDQDIANAPRYRVERKIDVDVVDNE